MFSSMEWTRRKEDWVISSGSSRFLTYSSKQIGITLSEFWHDSASLSTRDGVYFTSPYVFD